MAKVIGFCNLHDAPRLSKLTEKRSIGTVSFLGRYGLMDFALSNFSNSGIDRINILVDRHLHSVVSHVRDGSIWVNNTKTGGQRLFYNENNPSHKFNTDINNLLPASCWWARRSSPSAPARLRSRTPTATSPAANSTSAA